MFSYLKNRVMFLKRTVSIKLYKLLILIFIFLILGAFYHRLQLFPFPTISKIYNDLKIKYPQQFGILLYRIDEIRENRSYVEHNQRSKFIKIEDYKNGDNIWSDRLYFDHSVTNEMDNLLLIQIPRHYDELIRIETNQPLKVFRILCTNNDNNYYVDWMHESITMKIVGKSCISHKVVSKKYNEGLVVLPPGGPFTSDPLFIKKNSENQIIDIN